MVNPNLLDIAPAQLKAEFGFEAVITNAYIIRRTPEMAKRAREQGLHRLLGFDGPIMTDSGSFQQHMYGDVEVTNAETLAFQFEVGSDIATPLDLFTEPDEPEAKAESDWTETFARYEEALALPNPNGSLIACTVQGGSHLRIRRRAAQALNGVPPCVHPIGGVVPIMEGERYTLLADVIATVKSVLSPARPVHLFGAGHPVVLPLAVLLGCDLFDSSSYAKYAKEGRMIFPDGTRSLRDVVESPCACPVCSNQHPEDLRAMEARPRYHALLRHNLHVLAAEMRRVRQAIREESLWELAEERARTNPHMHEGLRRLALHADLLEEAEPLSRARAVRYFDSTSALRPLVERTRQRVIDRAAPPPSGAVVLLRAKGTPYRQRLPRELARIRRRARVPLVFETVWGPVPEALDECYPFSQTVAPAVLDAESASRVTRAVEAFSRRHAATKFLRFQESAAEEIERSHSGAPPSPEERALEQVDATLRYQFGPEAAGLLRQGAFKVERSRTTNKIRRVFVEGRHALSLRAHDGLFTLTFEGGRLLHAALPSPRHRVTVLEDTAPFNAEGRSVFAKFVKFVDPELRPGEEALVEDEGGRLVAVGRMLLSPRETSAFKHGVAVQVREGARSQRAVATAREGPATS